MFWIIAQIALIVVWFIVPTLPAWVVFLPTIAWLAIGAFTLTMFVTVAVSANSASKRLRR